MNLVPLGERGPQVSRVGLGCNNFGRRIDFGRTREVVDAAIEVGVTFFDTADAYGDGDSERFLGELLEGRRERVLLATKFGHGASAAARGSTFSRRSTRRSSGFAPTTSTSTTTTGPDGVTPLAETLGAMHELVDGRQGALSRRSPTSQPSSCARRMPSHARTEALSSRCRTSTTCCAVTQSATPCPCAASSASASCRTFRSPAACSPASTVAASPTRPEAGSRDESRDDVFDRIAPLEEFARSRGRTLLELAIAALASQPGVASVIAGATSAEQVRANAAAGDWELSEDDLAELASL